jgi:hypothetical protein
MPAVGAYSSGDDLLRRPADTISFPKRSIPRARKNGCTALRTFEDEQKHDTVGEPDCDHEARSNDPEVTAKIV